jgi:hypothetical protein
MRRSSGQRSASRAFASDYGALSRSRPPSPAGRPAPLWRSGPRSPTRSRAWSSPHRHGVRPPQRRLHHHQCRREGQGAADQNVTCDSRPRSSWRTPTFLPSPAPAPWRACGSRSQWEGGLPRRSGAEPRPQHRRQDGPRSSTAIRKHFRTGAGAEHRRPIDRPAGCERAEPPPLPHRSGPRRREHRRESPPARLEQRGPAPPYHGSRRPMNSYG